MKTIVIGYDNHRGMGKYTVLKDDSVPTAEQIKFVEHAKATNVFPDGVKQMQFCALDERVTAIEIHRPENSKPEKKTKK